MKFLKIIFFFIILSVVSYAQGFVYFDGTDDWQVASPQTITADTSTVAGLVPDNMVLATTLVVIVDTVTTDANDYIILPSLSDVSVGHTILVTGNSGVNFEVRTPPGSDEEINSEDCDGTNEYLFTDTELHYFVKINDTIGWMGAGFTAIGADQTPVVPD